MDEPTTAIGNRIFARGEYGVPSKNSTELKMRQMTRVGPFSKGRASCRLVAAILYVNNKVLTARFNGRTVESLILRNSLISKSDSFLTTHRYAGYPQEIKDRSPR